MKSGDIVALKYGNERVWHVEYYNPSTSKWELVQQVKYGSNVVYNWYDTQHEYSYSNPKINNNVATGTIKLAKLDSSKSYNNDTIKSSTVNLTRIRLGGGAIRIYNGSNFTRDVTVSETSSKDAVCFWSDYSDFSTIEGSKDDPDTTGYSFIMNPYSYKYVYLTLYSQSAGSYDGGTLNYTVQFTNGKTTLSAPNLTDTSSADSYAVYFQIKIRNTNGVPVSVYGKVGSDSYKQIRSNLNPSEEFTYYYGYIYGSTTFYAYFTTTSTSYTSQSAVNSVTNGPSGGGSTGS